MSVGDNVNHEVNGKENLDQDLLGNSPRGGRRRAGRVPRHLVELEKADGSRGFVSLTEVSTATSPTTGVPDFRPTATTVSMRSRPPSMRPRRTLHVRIRPRTHRREGAR